jgi:hypothetical protein
LGDVQRVEGEVARACSESKAQHICVRVLGKLLREEIELVLFVLGVHGDFDRDKGEADGVTIGKQQEIVDVRSRGERERDRRQRGVSRSREGKMRPRLKRRIRRTRLAWQRAESRERERETEEEERRRDGWAGYDRRRTGVER